MAVYLVTYDLNSPGQKHNQLLDFLGKTYGYARLSESSYAISSLETPEAIFNRLAPFLDGNDTLYVMQLNRAHHGRGDVDVNKWLLDKLQ